MRWRQSPMSRRWADTVPPHGGDRRSLPARRERMAAGEPMWAIPGTRGRRRARGCMVSPADETPMHRPRCAAGRVRRRPRHRPDAAGAGYSGAAGGAFVGRTADVHAGSEPGHRVGPTAPRGFSGASARGATESRPLRRRDASTRDLVLGRDPAGPPGSRRWSIRRRFTT